MLEGRQGNQTRPGTIPQEHRDNVQPDSETAAAAATTKAAVIT